MHKVLCFFLFLVSFSVTLSAQTTASQQAVIRGVVTVVLGETVTVDTDDSGEMAYGLTSQTRILKLNGQSGTIADITQGATVAIQTGANPNQATEVRLVEPQAKRKK